jgi:alpha-tubulin suppressor-like RCC1 family protein
MGVEAGSSSGSGDVTSRAYLSRIKSLEGKGVVCVKGGVHHSLVLTSNGEILAFGRGDSGQLGISMVSGEGGLSGMSYKVDNFSFKIQHMTFNQICSCV